jgi:hypothetical protein
MDFHYFWHSQGELEEPGLHSLGVADDTPQARSKVKTIGKRRRGEEEELAGRTQACSTLPLDSKLL